MKLLLAMITASVVERPSRAYRGSRNLRAVQQLLGHSSVGTTEFYCAVDDSEIRAAMEAGQPPGDRTERSIRAHLTPAVAVMGIAAAGLGIGALFLADAPAGPAVVTPAVHHSTVLGRGNLPVAQLPTVAPVLPSRVRPPT